MHTGIKVELDVRIFFLFRAVVVGTTADSRVMSVNLRSLLVARDDVHLDIVQLDGTGGCLRRDEVGEGNEGSHAGYDGGEEAKHILRANKRRMHVGDLWRAEDWRLARVML